MKAVWIRLAVVTGLLLLLTSLGVGLALKYAPRLRQVASQYKSPEQLQREHAAAEKFAQVSRENAVEQRRALTEGMGDTLAGSTARMDRAQTTLANVAGQFRGDERKEMELLQSRLVELREKTQAYESVVEELKQAGFFAPESLPSLAAIAERRALTQRWIDANAALAACLRDMEPKLRADLEKNLASRAQAASFASAFVRSAHLVEQQKIRELDRQMAELALAQLALLEAHWGQWKIEDTGGISFTQPAALAKYNAQQNAINEAAEAQVALQKQLLADSEKPMVTDTNGRAAATRPSPAPSPAK